MCRPFGTRLMSLILPGTAVPGYRLFRPCGTVSVAASIQAFKAQPISVRVRSD